ncbi:prepilin peptidase [Bifidobacterium thermophilum]|uniref:prepilin peptidase n=1 Tax=Bifidobacterium thermophilum TaxID=33905 RepID=UPI0030ADDBB8
MVPVLATSFRALAASPQSAGENTLAYGDTVTTVVVAVFAFVLGCVIGSFLNVVIWRVPNHISLVNPKRSFCPNCKAQIAWHDNIPIISWLVLRAKCRNCHQPISGRYPAVELLGGLAALAVVLGGAWHAYPLWMLPDLLFFAWLSIVVAFIDFDFHKILNVIIYPSIIVTLLLLVLASWGTGSWPALGRAAIAGAVLALFYLLLGFLWPGGMGMGDVKLAVLIGLNLGWLGWQQFIVGGFAAFIIGGAISVILLATKRVTIHGGIPFGPSMVIGAWVGILFGMPIAQAYLQLVGLA